MAAVVAINAANMAYRKAIRQTRDVEFLKRSYPSWMSYFAEKLPEKNDDDRTLQIKDTPRHKREAEFLHSESPYNQFAFYMWLHVTNTFWFESFIMVNIVAIGVSTGIDLQNTADDPKLTLAVNSISIITTVVFTIECICKITAEGVFWTRYFLDPDNGSYNCMDFGIVMGSFVFMGSTNGSAIGALRMLRLARLLTFVKGVKQLRVIVSGLLVGLKSVVYIVMLLFLVIYMFAIVACLTFGQGDPGRFGSVPTAMLTLFQVSTLATWASIAYTSW